MPVYSYKCDACDVRSDVLHGVFEDAPVVCQFCGGVMFRVPSIGGVSFKGDGWGAQ
jgi:putative FmdB family regulatory protein